MSVFTTVAIKIICDLVITAITNKAKAVLMNRYRNILIHSLKVVALRVLEIALVLSFTCLVFEIFNSTILIFRLKDFLIPMNIQDALPGMIENLCLNMIESYVFGLYKGLFYEISGDVLFRISKFSMMLVFDQDITKSFSFTFEELCSVVSKLDQSVSCSTVY